MPMSGPTQMILSDNADVHPVYITLDKAVDAAYISLAGKQQAGASKTMYACDPAKVGGMINLDFDDAGRLIGIEVLGAANKLPAALLDAAEESDVGNA
jgi:uncharacterized protein YuzE